MSLLVLYVACKIHSCKVLAKHSRVRLSTCIVYFSFDFMFCFYFKCQFHYSSDIISRTLRPYILSRPHNPVSAHSYSTTAIIFSLKSNSKTLIQLCLNYCLVQRAKAAASFWKILELMYSSTLVCQ